MFGIVSNFESNFVSNCKNPSDQVVEGSPSNHSHADSRNKVFPWSKVMQQFDKPNWITSIFQKLHKGHGDV